MNTNSNETTTQPAQPQKFLRYRSVRRAVAKDPEPTSPSPPPPLPNASQTSLTRLPSRYHRRPNQSTEVPPLPTPSQNVVTQNHSSSRPSQEPWRIHEDSAEVLPNTTRHERKPSGSRKMIIGHGQTPSHRAERSIDKTVTSGSSTEPPSPEQLRRSLQVAREEARLILEGEFDRIQALKQKEIQRQQEKQDAALEAQARGSQPVVSDGPPVSESQNPKPRTLVIGGSSATKAERQHKRVSSALPADQPSHEAHTRLCSTGKIGGLRESAPQFDAPVSAINAGERRVRIQCQESVITLPITPATTCKDILRSAASCLSEHIDVRTAVLLESFAQLGLERPLRRYERIREVMNSWANDDQNCLSIVAQPECAASGLHETDAPRQQPLGTTVQMYYSQRPGKWEKRWLRLKGDGQITMSKIENDIHCTNICHLSDFDLYTPTPKQVKQLKPPRKMCFALKSQEKSSMFLDGANFVHFFSTKDQIMAGKWYHEVQSWRSWYLFHMIGKGQQTREISPAVGLRSAAYRPSTGRSSKGSSSSSSQVLRSCKPRSNTEMGARLDGAHPPIRPSQNDVPKPLVDFGPEKPKPSVNSSKTGSPRHSHSKTQGLPPPCAYPSGKLITIESSTGSTSHAEASPFTGAGLLARSASRKSQGGGGGGGGSRPGCVVDGKPLVDLHPTSEFTDGSLLRKMEAIAAQQGNTGPKISRQKGREVSVSVGEGFD
ncbi:hypothetical protein LTR99_006518 [Exophiala xenobiotica]|uniref:PH domain-containing protein n=1 Tax=Vermiconidia calcicola TaxID=1690605 RepID=A0AAV9Q9N0_9PEZI|nr:hypothetical protein H2202_003593 [Exophiala xenobiotica]KAK5535626.1 hypothetical protein LTR23_008220 [Chaetothyriales sp. CCFEE 6169]KAK5537688.1 hypothetical protein LTR25_004940 [Vermiconidia calcicola]KAK5219100.1 hypothetical protein LTR72_008282 [Exophiala xenobiotica]KAK5267331.1 hypothetical protein LTR96_007364 [Exophiala xenobiotica]